MFPIRYVLAAFAACLTLCVVSAKDYSGSLESLPFEMQAPVLPEIPSLTVSLSDFGGKGDGIALNTEAFDRALTHLSEIGGGHLIVPSGIWLTGPIRLRSNIDLHLEKDAIVLFSSDKSLFPVIPADQGTSGTMRTPPVFAHNISNFMITGEGVFDGNGEYWRPYKRFKVSDAEWKKLQRLELKEDTLYGSHVYYPTLTNPTENLETKRARLIRVTGCDRFLIRGVVVQNSPSFHVNIVMSHDFVLDGITVRCPWNAQNGDGIDLSSCQRALLKDCSVVMCDIAEEAILFDSYYQEKVGDAGNAVAAPVTADTPRFDGFHISGVVCRDAGTAILCKGLPEMPVRNVDISDCSFTSRRGAVVNNAQNFVLENVTFSLPEGVVEVSGNSMPTVK